MTIQIDGTNTLNKGAELMLYSVLEQIQKEASDAKVLYNPNNYQQPIPIDTTLNVKYRFGSKYYIYINAIFKRLGLKSRFFTPFYARKVEVLFDAGGFQFSDQWKYSQQHLDNLEKYYKELYNMGTKLFFLPQALGPFENDYSKRCVEILNKYATLVIARENVSYNYIKDAGFNTEKLLEFPDFTLLTRGVQLSDFQKYNGFICVVPNKKMITNTTHDKNSYINFISHVIKYLEDKGEKIFLLNHEGHGDLELCNIINGHLGKKLDIVTSLNALEVKGVIGVSKLVISSRFHGVASALSQGVPCLATSWNHKYEMLFNDYGLSNKVFKINDLLQSEKLIEENLNDVEGYKNLLKERKIELENKINSMWRIIWNQIKN